MLHGLRHLLTPGSPGYAALKTTAVMGALGAQYAVNRRAARRREQEHAAAQAPGPVAPHAAARPHARSKKKKRTRGRR